MAARVLSDWLQLVQSACRNMQMMALNERSVSGRLAATDRGGRGGKCPRCWSWGVFAFSPLQLRCERRGR